MAEVPAKPLTISIEWIDPYDPVDDDDEPYEGSWSIVVQGRGEILRDTQYDSGDGFETLGEAVTAAEKWATDRRLDIKTFGVTLRAQALPLRGDG